MLFTEIIPKTLGVTFASRLAVPVTYMVMALVMVLKPMLWVTSWISKKLTAGHRKPVTSIEEIRLLAALGKHEGDVGPRFANFVEGVASLRELTVHDVMVPRVTVSYLSGNKSFEENLEVVRGCGHSRFPFTPSGDLDDVDGLLLAKELFFFDHDTPDGSEPDWESLKQPLLVVPETKRLDEALRLFQEKRKHLAVVVDEYGGMQGVITLEDVLEEIVGEIEDETDRVEHLILKNQDGSLSVRGHTETRKLFKVLHIDAKVDFVTVGGLVADLLGHVPQQEDVVEWENLQFTVTKATSRRAERISIKMLDGSKVPESKQKTA